jgi:inner membrane transporter RhtA
VGRRPELTGPTLVFGAAVSVQVGAAFAKSLFDEVGPPAVVLMRLAFGAVAVWLLYRPRFRGRTAGEMRLVLGLGVVLACMNTTHSTRRSTASRSASPSRSSSSGRSSSR